MLGLQREVAPGAGGLRTEFLKILAEKMSPDQMLLLEAFGLKYLSGDLPTWFYSVWPSVQTVAV